MLRKIALFLTLLFLAIPASASIGFRGSPTVGTNTTAATSTISLPTGTTNGDVTVITIENAAIGCLNVMPSGWTKFLEVGGMSAFYRAYQTGDPTSLTYTLCGTVAGTGWAGMWSTAVAISYTGADTSNPIDGAVGALNWGMGALYTTVNVFAPEFVAAYNGGLQVAAFGYGSTGGTTVTTPSGFTLRENDQPGPGISIYDKAIVSGGYFGQVQTVYSAMNNLPRPSMSYSIKASGASAATAASGVSLVAVMLGQSGGPELRPLGNTIDIALLTPVHLQANDLVVIWFGLAQSNTASIDAVIPTPPLFNVSYAANNARVFAKTVGSPVDVGNLSFENSISASNSNVAFMYIDCTVMVFRAVGSVGGTPYPALTVTAGTNNTNPSTGLVAPSVATTANDSVVLFYPEITGSAETYGIVSGAVKYINMVFGPDDAMYYITQPANPTGTHTMTGTLTSVTQAYPFTMDVTLSASKTGTTCSGGGGGGGSCAVIY